MQRIVLLLCVLSACGHESVQTSDTAVDTDSGEKHNNDSDTPTVDTDSTETTCATPIQEEYPFLMLLPGFQERTEISPGSETTIRVGLLQCCVFFEPIPTCAVYSIQPENQSATIDPENGLLVVDEDVPDSTRFTLTADIEDGQFVVEQPVFVYQKALHPLRGFWFNKSSKTRTCLVSPVVYGDVLQLIFSASGQYFVFSESDSQ